jgi:hypothetical protein
MTVLEIIAVLMLILGAGFFAMAEFSVVSSHRNRLEQLAAQGHRGAQAAIELAEQPVRFLAAVQVGTTLSTMLVGALTGAVLAARLASWVGGYRAIAPFGTLAAMIIVIAASTYVSLILGEMLPKQIALKYPEAIASRIAPSLAVLARVAAPIVWALDSSTNFVLCRLRLGKGPERTVTEEDIHNIVAEGAKLGIIHHVERDMIESVLDLADSPVRSIMTPRPHLIWMDINELCRRVPGCAARAAQTSAGGGRARCLRMHLARLNAEQGRELSLCNRSDDPAMDRSGPADVRVWGRNGARELKEGDLMETTEPWRAPWRELIEGSTVWAPFGDHGWRPSIIIGLGKNRADHTVVHLSFETGGKGRRLAGELWWRKVELRGKDKPKAQTVGA